MSDQLGAHDAALARLQRLHPKAIDLSLDRVQRLLADLGHPELGLPPVVHVAGTNGKGSTTALLRAIAEAAGLRVHVHTSPHLVRFAERIRLAGRLIQDDQLNQLLERVEAANDGQPITFFEITAAATFLAFSETPADLAIVEVGLGGRFDATNVIDRPALCVIAPVDYDHAEFLGTDLAGIAREKAGILKPGVPCVVAHQRPEALDAIEAEAERVGARLILAGRDFDAWREGDRLLLQYGETLHDLPLPSLLGPHQIGNAGVATAAALALGLPEAALDGVAKASWPARMQRLTAGPLAGLAHERTADLWLDGAHNPHAARAMAETLAAMQARDGRPTALVVGLLANKDAAGVFEALLPLGAPVFAIGFEATAAADPESLAATARAAGLTASAYPNVTEGVKAALAAHEAAPRVVICGSLYLAGEVLGMSRETWPQ
jgi:dihydrofolate synthase/folylpolyglutamate synthase